jgi:hypothetical protein
MLALDVCLLAVPLQHQVDPAVSSAGGRLHDVSLPSIRLCHPLFEEFLELNIRKEKADRPSNGE